MRHFRYKKILLLFIPFILTLIGINYGLPLHLVGDEESLVGGAIKMIELQQPIPILAVEEFKFLYYPPVIPYLYVLGALPVIIFKFIFSGFDILTIKDYFALNLNSLWISARIMTAIFSIGVLLVTYKIAKTIFSKKAAYLSVILLSASFFHVFLSHWARHWIFTVFFSYLTILLALLFFKGQLKKHWLIGVSAGISLGTAYLNFISFSLSILILWFHRRQIEKPIKKIFINIFLTLVVGSSLVVMNLPDLLRFRYGGETLGEPMRKSFMGFLAHLSQSFTVLFNQEIIILFLSILSLLLWKRYLKIKIFILVNSLIYLTFLYYFLHFENRYIYFIIPALVILSADSLVYLYETINNKKIYFGILVLLFLWPVLSIFNYTRLVLSEDTRELAVSYIKENIKEQEFFISSPYIYLPRTYNSLNRAQDYGHINARERYIFTNYDRLGNNFDQLYNYQNIHFWQESFQNVGSLEDYTNTENPQYFILEYWDETDIDEVLNDLRQNGDLVKIFKQSVLAQNYDINGNYGAFNSILFKLDRLGPTIEIYKLK